MELVRYELYNSFRFIRIQLDGFFFVKCVKCVELNIPRSIAPCVMMFAQFRQFDVKFHLILHELNEHSVYMKHIVSVLRSMNVDTLMDRPHSIVLRVNILPRSECSSIALHSKV